MITKNVCVTKNKTTKEKIEKEINALVVLKEQQKLLECEIDKKTKLIKSQLKNKKIFKMSFVKCNRCNGEGMEKNTDECYLCGGEGTNTIHKTETNMCEAQLVVSHRTKADTVKAMKLLSKEIYKEIFSLTVFNMLITKLKEK